MSWSEKLQPLARRSTLKLTHYGRKSGKPYQVTIWFVVKGEHIYLGTANARRQWVQNVRKTARVKLTIGDQTFEGEGRFLSDRAEHQKVMAMVRGKYWHFWPFLATAGLLQNLGLVVDHTGSFEITLHG